jgi:hypothetical protein
MKTILQLTVLAAALTAAGCSRDASAPEPAAPAAAQPGLQPWTLPTGPGAAQPDLTLAPDGRLLLSWLDVQDGRRTRFQFAQFGDANWDVTRTIAIGSSFFTNWADTPHILATPDGALWVQWLQKSGAAPYAYDVVLSTSRNDGMNWSAPIRPHTDGTITEHGFAALWPQGNDRLGIAWLDGRNTAQAKGAGAGEGEHDAHAGGAMTLRSASFDGSLRIEGDIELDASVCDCCQTDVAVTAKGPLLVYRDRSEDEIRDIHVVRKDGAAWGASKPVSSDNWRMPACPVNGPSVAAQGNAAVVGWYTAAGDTPTVKLAHSGDAGDTFATPVVLDQGEVVQGRVDVALDANAAWVLWTREDAAGQSLWLARYAPDLSRQIEKVEVARLQAKGRGTGFAQLALRDGRGYIVWTDIADKTSSLHGAIFTPKPGAKPAG